MTVVPDRGGVITPSFPTPLVVVASDECRVITLY